MEFNRFIEQQEQREGFKRSKEDYCRIGREVHEHHEVLREIEAGMEDCRRGRTRPAAEVLAEIRREVDLKR